MDEKTSQQHLNFVPQTKGNRLCAKEILGERADLSRWQDDFYAHMIQTYPNLERSESTRETGRKHIPTRIFKQAISLSKQAKTMEAVLDGINPLNGARKKEEALILSERHVH